MLNLRINKKNNKIFPFPNSQENRENIWDIVHGRPCGSVGNLETFSRWDVSSNLGVVTRTGIYFSSQKNIGVENKYSTSYKICPTSGERLTR